ncbi:MAG: RagB/SusD family nutrient uptake outer membrane protein [Bacteroidales bacterium]|nr:RagB/SusD family nutrient uptake outer membrane protein [Bacteroidales bacterium]
MLSVLFHLNGENDATAWSYINQIRSRAFGNMEVGKKDALTATYLPYYKEIASFYISKGSATVTVPSSYPIPFNETAVTVPDAKTYYTQVKSDKSFSSPVWLVALGMERRKEFNAEWCLAQDLIRSGFMEDHITHNYPKSLGYPNTNPLVQDAWQTYRSFDYVPEKMDMPIPTEELLKNKLIDQNEAYN